MYHCRARHRDLRRCLAGRQCHFPAAGAGEISVDSVGRLPNVKKLKEAQGLVSQGKLAEAHAILVETLVTAPKSPVTGELRDLLSNVNTRMFFSKQPSPRKTEYTVKRGDTLASIARKLNSSPEAIMRVNDLDSTLIHIGEKLLVPRLDFQITIDLPSNRLVLHDADGFFAQYPIGSANLPRSKSHIVQTAVTAKSSFGNGMPRHDHQPEKQAPPQINLARVGYALYGIEQNKIASNSEIGVADALPFERDPKSPARGIAMLKDDLSEIELLIRKGTPVTIIRNRQ